MTTKFFTYIVENQDYDLAHLFKLDQEDPPADPLEGIGTPVDTGYSPLTPPAGRDSETPRSDLILDSYIGRDGNNQAVLRFILGKIVTQPAELGQTSDVCYYTELSDIWRDAGEAWDVILKDNGNNTVATNPHGFAQLVGSAIDKLYISDYDATKIWLLGCEDIKNATQATPTDPFTLTLPTPIDIPVGDVLPELPEPGPEEDYQYHGNGIMALQDSEGDWYLFALFIASNNVPTPEDKPDPYLESQLVRIKLNSDGTAAVAGGIVVAPVGRNAVDMDVTDDGGNPVILITAIGGPQKGDDGAAGTNGTYSKITKVYDLFSATFTELGNITDLLIGDAGPYGDFRGLAVGSDGNVNILAGHFNSISYTGFDWAVYRIGKGALLDLNELPLSEAVEEETLEKIGGDTGTGGYFWGIVAGGGLLILTKGSEMVITREADPDFTEYAPGNEPDPIRNVIFHRGTAAGDIGDANINSLDFTWATEQLLQQLASDRRLGGHHHHRHHRHHHIRHLAQQAMRAALAAGIAGGVSEETGGK
jgi:hypothetical protein